MMQKSPPLSQNPILYPIRLTFMRWVKPLSYSVREWPAWWSQLSLFEKVTPLSAILFYWISLFLLKGFRGDHITLGFVILTLSYSGRKGRQFLNFALPFLLTAIVYDSQRFYADYIRGPIHVSEPYHFDRTWFGVSTESGILTPNEWWQKHTSPFLDFITGFAYLVFFTVFILISAYFAYYLGRIGTKKYKAVDLAASAYRMPWAFFWLNVLGYSTYYWYAAAPPWYVALYGLGPARMDVAASSAGCVRFDEMLGTHFFSEMYGRAADVFGAIPSLHVAYPLLAVFFAFQFGSARLFCICFYLLMCFSAIYLNHHYVLDILWGSSYALLVGWLTNQVFDFKNQRQLKTPAR